MTMIMMLRGMMWQRRGVLRLFGCGREAAGASPRSARRCRWLAPSVVAEAGGTGVAEFQREPLVAAHAAFLDTVADLGTGECVRTSEEDGEEQHGGIVRLRLSNPESKNALSGRMMRQLAEHVDRLSIQPVDHHGAAGEESPLTALVLTGDRDVGVFCSGMDLALARGVLSTPEQGRALSRFMTDLLTRLRNLPLATLALVNGPAVGGGAEICTAMDWRIMQQDTAFIRFIHTKLGVVPGWGAGTRLTQICGRRAALRLLTSAQAVTPAQALELGLADVVCSSEDHAADTAVREFLAPLTTQHPHPHAVRAAKAVVAAADSLPAEQAAQIEHSLFTALWASDANKQSIT